MKEKIEINNEDKKEMIKKIKEYFYEEREEEIGELAATLVLSFFLEELGPYVYNLGVYDSYRYMSERIEDLLTIQK
jgi:uncharacterized protein (DUF2164 family)